LYILLYPRGEVVDARLSTASGVYTAVCQPQKRADCGQRPNFSSNAITSAVYRTSMPVLFIVGPK